MRAVAMGSCQRWRRSTYSRRFTRRPSLSKANRQGACCLSVSHYTNEQLKAARAAFEIQQAFADTRRFCSESLMVQDMQGRLVPFVWNPAQAKLDQAVKKQRASGLPVRLIIVKSRRVGFSTGVAGIIFKETPFIDGQPALVVA